MAKYRLHATATPAGWNFQLHRKAVFGKDKPIPVDQWAETATSTLPGVALLLALANAGEASTEPEHIAVAHERIAKITGAEARLLNLPPVTPFSLFLDHRTPVTDSGFRIDMKWQGRDGLAVLGARRTGSCLATGQQRYLLLDPLFSLLQAVEAVNEPTDDMDQRMVRFGRFKEQLAELTGDERFAGEVRTDAYLGGITIHHATGLGVDLYPADQTADFEPMLYGEQTIDSVALENEDQEPEREPLLPRTYDERFRQRFQGQGSRRHYTLGNRVYVVLDAPVTAALKVIERVNRADRETRQAFQKDPLSFLTPAVEEAGGDGSVICDLRGYGDRVIGIGPWEQVKLSFRIPVEREWFPEADAEVFTLHVPDSEPLVVQGRDVTALKEQIETARDAGSETIEFQGRTVPLSEPFVDAVRKLTGYVEPKPVPPPKPEPPESPGQQVAITVDNEESLQYRAELRARRAALASGVDGIATRNSPKAHQRDGILWLQKAFLSGMPGVLLADDMGLGKTFQVLAFLRWLRDGTMQRGRQGRRHPMLIVAPKTLLGNWCEEIDNHLGKDALGTGLHAYGSSLRALKQVSGSGNDIRLGRQTLDIARIEDSDWVLTTYESLRDYHLSFGKIPFSVIVYDEAQKLKNPTSLMNRGAKAQQGDFTVIMTGTPIENSVLDLWTLLDIAYPGLLNLSGKAFIRRYGEADAAARAELKAHLVEPRKTEHLTLPSVMLRRFKTQILDGLPEKTVQAPEETMPPEQAAAYSAVVQDMHSKARTALGALQAMRSVSLHPNLSDVPQSADQHAAYINASARFRQLFRILDDIHRRQEKTLVFVDFRAAQEALYLLIKHRYGLSGALPECINGETAAAVRDRIRQRFQAPSDSFDVLLLGPKAAGFGLTLTAANHVIHLNRWWNPAVEDQCSDRVYRIGQNKPVTVYLPQAVHPEYGEASFDRILHTLLEEKRALSREIVVPTQFNEQDFRRFYEQATGQEGQSAELERVDHMDWRSFERWTAAEIRKNGFDVNETPRTGDGGADLVAVRQQKGKQHALIVQCKHRALGENRSVDDAAVGEVVHASGRYPQYRSAALIALTNGTFTLAAETLAREKRVELIDRTRLHAIDTVLSQLAG